MLYYGTGVLCFGCTVVPLEARLVLVRQLPEVFTERVSLFGVHGV